MPQKMKFLDKIKIIGHFSRKVTRPRPSDTVGSEDRRRGKHRKVTFAGIDIDSSLFDQPWPNARFRQGRHLMEERFHLGGCRRLAGGEFIQQGGPEVGYFDRGLQIRVINCIPL